MTDSSAAPQFPLGFSTYNNEDLWLPTAAELSEGYDVRCRLPEVDAPGPRALTLAPGDEATVGTGPSMTAPFPESVALLVLPRSSTGKRSISVRNSPGLIDRAYVGREIFIMLRNDGRAPQTIEHGERIAQLVFVLCARPTMHKAAPPDAAAIGREGFGSTGKF